MIVLRTAAQLRVGDESLDVTELGRLLTALVASPQVGAAARALGISYRGAWGKIVEAERLLGVSLVERVKGHGSRLTAAGLSLARASQRFESTAERRLAAPAFELGEQVEVLRGVAARALRLAASHDLLLQAVVSGEHERRPEGGDAARPDMSAFAVRFVGSEQALLALARGEADLAGFHLPEPMPAMDERPEVFRDTRLFVEPLVRREQGLIVAGGNPLRIRDVADLARTGLRFVNRQRGAGTRAWFDRLLREHGLQPRQIRGYEREEFTHLAVAASVAAGLADAGFGLRAAAVRLGLGYVPVGTERYFIAGAIELRGHPALRALVRDLRARARSCPGYAPCVSGEPRMRRRRSAAAR